MNNLHDELGFPHFNYDPKNVLQITKEDDSVHGMELHKIRKEVDFQKPDWDKVLPQYVNDWILKEYADINELAYK